MSVDRVSDRCSRTLHIVSRKLVLAAFTPKSLNFHTVHSMIKLDTDLVARSVSDAPCLANLHCSMLSTVLRSPKRKVKNTLSDLHPPCCRNHVHSKTAYISSHLPSTILILHVCHVCHLFTIFIFRPALLHSPGRPNHRRLPSISSPPPPTFYSS